MGDHNTYKLNEILNSPSGSKRTAPKAPCRARNCRWCIHLGKVITTRRTAAQPRSPARARTGPSTDGTI